MPLYKLKEIKHSLYHNDTFKPLDNFISQGFLTEGKSYMVERTPLIYDPQTFQPTYAYIIICNDQKSRKISKEIIETYFQSQDEWREEQLNKLIPEEPNPYEPKIDEFIILITRENHFLTLYSINHKELIIEDERENNPEPFGLPMKGLKPNHLHRLTITIKPGTQETKLEESPIADYITITRDPQYKELLKKWDYTFHLDKGRPQIHTLLKQLKETPIILRDEKIGKIL